MTLALKFSAPYPDSARSSRRTSRGSSSTTASVTNTGIQQHPPKSAAALLFVSTMSAPLNPGMKCQISERDARVLERQHTSTTTRKSCGEGGEDSTPKRMVLYDSPRL